MPTDLDAATAARKRAAQAETQTLVTIVLVWAIISLGMLVLMLAVVGQYSRPRQAIEGNLRVRESDAQFPALRFSFQFISHTTSHTLISPCGN